MDKIKTTKKERLIKIVLRRLPYGMSEKDLLEQLDPIHESIQQYWFIKADLEILPFAFSRAYFIFNEESDAISFCDRFNGYVFVDKQGNESVAIAELAPCQTIYNKNTNERDKRINTIESDSEYLKFLERYNNFSFKKVVNFDNLLKELEDKHNKKNFVCPTPLTEFVQSKDLIFKDRRRIAREKFNSNNLKVERNGKGPISKHDRNDTVSKQNFETKNFGRDKRRSQNYRSEIENNIKSEEVKSKTVENNVAEECQKIKLLVNKTKLTNETKEPETKNLKEEDKNEVNNEKNLKQAPRRNKFRPERPIYQPGMRNKSSTN